ncbi:MAG: HlyD family type I secretion periplasmic adaptor subunit [Methylocella sp.]
MMKKSEKSISDWRGIAVAGYAVIILTFGVVGVWAAVAKLDKAVVAPGFVAVETNRKSVQHFEGGMVREIFIKEGDHVTKGEVLFSLKKVQAQANNDLVKNQLDSGLALEARLLAERDQKENITWPEEFSGRSAEPLLARIMTDQIHQFQERHTSLEGQVSVLESRIEQLTMGIKGIAIEKDSTEKQVGYINDELVNLRDLGKKQLVPMTRVYAMERERTRLEGVIGHSIADTAKAQSSIGEIKIQIQQLRQKFQEDIASSLLEVRQKIADARERVTVAGDVLNRVEIVAPLDGTVQNLKVFTVGQVLRPAETLLEIVPDEEPLVVNAQFSPNDIDTVYGGQQAEIRFPAFHSREIPLMMGRIESISHDRLMDEQTRQFYFLGVISLDRSDIPEEYRPRIRPGMPAEVIVASGERTVLSYIISPLSESLRKSFRER